MLSLVSTLKMQGVTFSLKYYGQQDLATGWDLKTLIDHSDLIIRHFELDTISEINDIETLIDYYTLAKVVKFKELIPLIIEDENKVVASDALARLEPLFCDIKKSEVVKFLNQNFEQVFAEEDDMLPFELIPVALETVIQFQNGISNNVFNHIIENYNYLVFDHYHELRGRIEKDKILFSLLFSKTSLLEALKYRKEELYRLLILVNNLKDTGKAKIIQDAIEQIIFEEEKKAATISIDNVMHIIIEIRSTLTFLHKIKHVKANIFERYMQKADLLLCEYLEQSGQHFSYRIQAEKILNKLKEDKPWVQKLLMLTHSTSTETKVPISILNKPPEKKKKLVDLASTNRSTDEYFTFSHQKYLGITLAVGATTMCTIFRDEDILSEYYSCFLGFLQYIYSKINCLNNEHEYEFQMITEMIHNIFNNENADMDKIISESLCYGASMFICAFTEKLLKTVYVCMLMETQYIPINKGTIGDLLSEENPLFSRIFGEYQLKHLRYFFHTCGDKRIGKNYRNNLAHWSDIGHEELTPILVAELMYLLTDMVNSLVVYFHIQDMEEMTQQSG